MNTLQFTQWSDEQLVTAFQQAKDMAIIDVLYRRYYRNVFFYCFHITGNREDALDLSSDIFLKVIEHLNNLREAMAFQAWLFRIARNRSVNLCRQKQKKQFSAIEEITHPTEPALVQKKLEEREFRISKMEEAFQRLPRDTKALLKAKYYEGQSINELTKRYRISESAVKMRLARARSKVVENFAAEVV